jgi:hypothetical protein
MKEVHMSFKWLTSKGFPRAIVDSMSVHGCSEDGGYTLKNRNLNQLIVIVGGNMEIRVKKMICIVTDFCKTGDLDPLFMLGISIDKLTNTDIEEQIVCIDCLDMVSSLPSISHSARHGLYQIVYKTLLNRNMVILGGSSMEKIISVVGKTLFQDFSFISSYIELPVPKAEIEKAKVEI